MPLDYKIKHEELKPDCISFTVIEIELELETAKKMNDLKRVERYNNLIKQGEEYIPLCKGPDAPDYCINKEIATCKGCDDYRSYDKV